MRRAGAYEVHFPALLPREPYEATGRWEEYGDGIFRLQDRKGADYLLAPTHEEVFTLLVKDLYSSYKDLPLAIYQIQDKYRDEARPRAGLLRGREFTMKDAYSFDYTDAGLDASYQAQRDAYERIFPRLGLEYVIVAGGRRAMGGSRSEEFLHPTPSARTPSCARPAATRRTSRRSRRSPRSRVAFEQLTPGQVLDSPNTPDDRDARRRRQREAPAARRRAWTAADTLKNVVLALTHLDGTREVVVVGIPGDREVDDKRVEVRSRRPRSSRRRRRTSRRTRCSSRATSVRGRRPGAVLGEESATGIRYLRRSARRRRHRLDHRREHRREARLRSSPAATSAPTASSRSPRCARATRRPTAPARSSSRAAWRSATSSSSAATSPRRSGCKVLDENGKLVTVTMGSYGIGVTRILAIIAELNNDDKGLIWPASVAPFDVHVVATGKDAVVFDARRAVSADLEAAGSTCSTTTVPRCRPA